MNGVSLVGLIVSLLAPSAGQHSAPPARRFEISASLGTTNLARKTGSYPRGFESSTLFSEVRVGVAWTPHLRTELAIASTGKRRDTFEEELWDLPAQFDDVFLSHNYRIVTFTAAPIYEFGSRRFRPFVGAGLGVDVDRNHDSREDFIEPALTPAQRQSYVASGTVLTPIDLFPCVTLASPRGSSQCGLPNPDHTSVRVYGFVTAGFKASISERAFWSLQIAIGKPLVRRFGVGIGLRF